MPPLVDAQPAAGRTRRDGGAPQHGMEREPDFFHRPRRKKDRKK
ncbi:hypothetical protein [Georgenia sp. SUBG003]